MLKTLVVIGAIVGGAFAAASTVGALLVRRGRGMPARPSDVDIDLLTTMSGTNFVSTAQGFEGGRITTWSGGTECDLREATLAPGGADIEILNVFGGTDIRVPAGWDVTIDVNALFGGTSGPGTNPGLAADTPELRIHGRVLFGGLSVRSE